MAEENANFLKKIGSGVTLQQQIPPSHISLPILPTFPTTNVSPYVSHNPNQLHKQQLEKLMNQQQKQKEELNKLFGNSNSSNSSEKSIPSSREEFFQQRVFVPTVIIFFL